MSASTRSSKNGTQRESRPTKAPYAVRLQRASPNWNTDHGSRAPAPAEISSHTRSGVSDRYESFQRAEFPMNAAGWKENIRKPMSRHERTTSATSPTFDGVTVMLCARYERTPVSRSSRSNIEQKRSRNGCKSASD